VFTVGATLFATHGAGEGQAFVALIFDLPLVLLLQASPRGSYILYGSTTAYIWVFSIAGTLLYAGVGCGLGMLVRGLIARIKPGKEPDRNTPCLFSNTPAGRAAISLNS
jgi:hypothetical protein